MPNLSSLIGGAIKSVQRGTITVAGGSTSNTATVTAVDTSKSELRMLGFSGSSTSSGGAEEWAVRIALTNGTTVTATRAANTQSVTVSFELTEFW